MGNRKWDLEKVREVFFNRGYVLLDDVYYVSSEKLTAKDKDGYKIHTKIGDINCGKTPDIFGKFNPYTIENIHHYIEINGLSDEVELISDTYETALKYLIFRCKIHNVEFKMTWGNFYSKHGCKLCGFDKISAEKRLDFNVVKSRYLDKGLKLLVKKEDYNGVHTKMDCIDKLGYKYSVGYTNVCSANVHYIVDNENPFTLENIRNYIVVNGLKDSLELVSDTYVDANTNLIFKCLIHDMKFNKTWGQFSSGHQCPLCGIERRSGENSPSWKGGLSSINNYMRTNILEWKKDSIKNCDYKCDISGERFDAIHHLYNFSDIVKETFNELEFPIYQEIGEYTQDQLDLIKKKNLELHYKYGLGVCLSEKLHIEFHSIYGNRNNTKEQYYEFKINKETGGGQRCLI